MAVIAQHHSPLFVTTQKVRRVKRLDNSLDSGDRDEGTIVIKAVTLGGSLLLSSMRCINSTKKVLRISHLVNFDPDDYMLVSSCVKDSDVTAAARS